MADLLGVEQSEELRSLIDRAGGKCGIARFVVVARTGCGEELVLTFDEQGNDMDVLDVAHELNLAIRGLMSDAVEELTSALALEGDDSDE